MHVAWLYGWLPCRLHHKVSLWVPLAVGVLTLLGAIGGALGAQFIAGRNDARRWKLESERERESHWREKRFDAYSDFLAEATLCLTTVSRSAVVGEDPATTERDVRNAFPGQSVKIIELIAPTDVAELCGAVVVSIAASLRAYVKDGAESLELQLIMDLLDAQLTDLHHMFRRDLGVAESRPRSILSSLKDLERDIRQQAGEP